MRTHAAALALASLATLTVLATLTSAAGDASATATATATAPATAPPLADLDAATGATCGDAPLAPCPLLGWMKTNAGPAAVHADTDPATLAAVLDRIASFAPPGYPSWVSIARDGAAAARAGQGDAAKASCRGCHTQYKAKYKTEIRSRPLPPA